MLTVFVLCHRCPLDAGAEQTAFSGNLLSDHNQWMRRKYNVDADLVESVSVGIDNPSHAHSMSGSSNL